MYEEETKVVRVPKIIHISRDEYHEKYWPGISRAVAHILSRPDDIHISCEEVHRAIYHVCCQRYASLLHEDLVGSVAHHVQQISDHLLSVADDAMFLETLCPHLLRFRKSVDVLGGLFRYLERVYSMEKYGTPLSFCFFSLFKQVVLLQTHTKNRIYYFLLSISNMGLDPTLVKTLLTELYALDKEYAVINPQAFSLYIPCLKMSRGIETDVQETIHHIAMLRNQGYGAESSNLKRKFVATMDA